MNLDNIEEGSSTYRAMTVDEHMLHDSKKNLTYHQIESPLMGKSPFVALGSIVVAGFFILSSAAAGYAQGGVWDDEITPEPEPDPEGIELYDSRAQMINEISGEYLQAESYTSPDLFENIGDGDFVVEWDVYIDPAEGNSSNDTVEVSLFYDSEIDFNARVERCEIRYSYSPNFQGEKELADCEGDSAQWEEVVASPSGYVGNLLGSEEIGAFNTQNSAYLKITVEPTDSSLILGDTINRLEIHAEVNDERLAIGHEQGNSRIESSSEDVLDETESEPSEEPVETSSPEPEPSPSVEETPTDESSPTEASSPVITEEEEEDEDFISTILGFFSLQSMLAILGLLIFIAIGVYFLSSRSKNGVIGDDYLDSDEDDDDDDDYYTPSRNSSSFR